MESMIEPISQTSPGWCVVVVKPNFEHVAAKALIRVGYRTYLPQFKRLLSGVKIIKDPDIPDDRGRRVRTRGMGDYVLRPLFTGYVFAELWPHQEWSPIKRAVGVQRIIINDDAERGPLLVADEIIQIIRDDERKGLWDACGPRSDLQKMLKNGEQPLVRVPGLNDIIGRLVALDELGRAEIEPVEAILAIARLRVDVRVIELASEGP